MKNFIKRLSAIFMGSAEAHTARAEINAQKIPAPPPAPKQTIEDLENEDAAAKHIFDILGEPVQHIASNRAYKTWAIEFELSEALEKIESGEIPPEIGALFQKTITAFTEALDSGDHKNYQQKSNYFTIAYGVDQFFERRTHQSHHLSIGCPIGTNGAPRFTMEISKPTYITENIESDSGVWIQNKTIYDNMIMNFPAPAPFYKIGLEFFRYLETAYNPSNAPDSNQKFMVGGAYGPSGTLG